MISESVTAMESHVIYAGLAWIWQNAGKKRSVAHNYSQHIVEV
jgi:hypothetical protein